MAKIIDPDLLGVGYELAIDTTGKTFGLSGTGNLTPKDGVSAQALYSKFVDLWTTSAYNKYPFPGYVIGDPRAGMFVWGFDGASYNGWKPLNDTTRTYVRDAGWSEYSSGGVLNRQYVGAVSLGDINSGAQLYFQRASTDAPTNFTFADEGNEAIQIYGDASNGNFDKKAFFKVFCREYQYSYASANLTLIGETATGSYKIGLPVANALDLNIVASDAVVLTGGTYTPIGVKYFSGAFSIDVDTPATPRDFGIVIDVGTWSGIDGVTTAGGSTITSAAGGITGTDYAGGTVTIHEGTNKGTYTISGTPTGTVITITGTTPNALSNQSFTIQRVSPITATKQQIYTKIAYLLRQNSDIDQTAGSVTGKTADLLLSMAGSTLETGKGIPANPNGGGTGVYVSGFQPDDATTIDFYDNTATKRNFPFNATGTLNFNSFLVGAGGYYRMYFTALGGALDDYGESGAVTVNDKDASPIAGSIGTSSISWSFAYDSNTQGGRSSGTTAAVTVVAGRPGQAKPVVTAYTITRAVGQGITLTAEQDRGYSNP
jgi:hypothetical protein